MFALARHLWVTHLGDVHPIWSQLQWPFLSRSCEHPLGRHGHVARDKNDFRFSFVICSWAEMWRVFFSIHTESVFSGFFFILFAWFATASAIYAPHWCKICNLACPRTRGIACWLLESDWFALLLALLFAHSHAFLLWCLHLADPQSAHVFALLSLSYSLSYLLFFLASNRYCDLE